MVYPESWKCPNCQKVVKNNKVCPECKFEYSMHYPTLWSCPECGELVHESRSCPKCNYPNELHYPKLWHCPKCNNLIKSSTKCSECGYESRENEFINTGLLIQKKLSKYKNLLKKRKNLLLLSVGLITFLGLLILFTLPIPRRNYVSNNKTINAGEFFSLVFRSGSSNNEVVFELTSPRGEIVEYEGVESETGVWAVNKLKLNESGNWSLTVYIHSFSGITEVMDVLRVKPVCYNHSDCNNSKICCFGTCTESKCYNNSECNDENEHTINSCINSGSCIAECVSREVSCSLYEKDDYCPSNCNKYTDADCNNCPSGLIPCSGSCYETCYSNSDCDDNNSSTIDKCIQFSNPCDSYCTHELTNACEEGKVLVNGECIKPVCSSSNDCEPMQGYAVKCWNPGTSESYCYYQKCEDDEIVCPINNTNACIKPVCNNNEDCDEGEPNVFYYCMNHGSCEAYCTTIT